MKYSTIEQKMLAGYMPAGYAAVTRRQVVQFLCQLFKLEESSVTRWRQKNHIPDPRAAVLSGLYPEFKEDR